MNKKLIISVLLVLGLFGISLVSAHHSSTSYDWDRINDVVENRVAHNRLGDYFKYGSYYQHGGYYPIYRDLSSTKTSYFPHGNRLTINNHWHNNDYGGNRIKIYGGYDRPVGREHAGNRAYVMNCGYGDGFYRDCY